MGGSGNVKQKEGKKGAKPFLIVSCPILYMLMFAPTGSGIAPAAAAAPPYFVFIQKKKRGGG